MRRGRNGKKSCNCQFIYLYLYLSDDLAIFSMDLSNASPLRQEGKYIIELEKKKNRNTETVNNYSGTVFIFKNPAGLFTQESDTPFYSGGHPQATI